MLGNAPMTPMRAMHSVDVDYLNKILMPDGLLIAHPSQVYEDIPYDHLRLWCHTNAVYGLPSVELLDLLRGLFEGVTIEIGAGNGVFGRELYIPSTDSYIQNSPEMQLYYSLLKQPTVKYGVNVFAMDAVDATKHFGAQTVFGSWVTQRTEDEDGPDTEGCYAGIDEYALSRLAKRYIVYGNRRIHANKKIFKLPGIRVDEYAGAYMWSRAAVPEDNRVWVFDFPQV